MDIAVNYWAAIVAGVLSFIVAWAWYSPMLFAGRWMKEIGVTMPVGTTPKMDGAMYRNMAVGLLAQIITAFVLEGVIGAVKALHIPNTTGISGVVYIAVWMWLGFFATKLIDPVLWEKRSLTWYAIVAGYSLVQLLIMAAVIILWPW